MGVHTGDQRSSSVPLAATALLAFILGIAWQRIQLGPARGLVALGTRGTGLVRSGGTESCPAHLSPMSALAKAALPELQRSVASITMLSVARRKNVVDVVSLVLAEGIPGDILEAGVWKGGASLLMKATLVAHCSTKQLYACDSYQGLPSYTEVDKALPEERAKPMVRWTEAGALDFEGGVETVKSHFRQYGLLDDRVHFVVGYFNETLYKMAEPRQLSVLRMDGDMYSSTMDILNTMYDRVAPGGAVIIDDYGFWPQCRAAVKDFFRRRGEAEWLEKSLVKIDEEGVWFRKAASQPR